MASTVLPNGIIIPEKYSRDWYNDLYHNWQELDNLLGGGTPKDGTLTIQKNGATVGTFSANQATDETINITVPNVNDGTLTIQKNGTTVDTFTANSSTDKTVNIAVPTKTSDLTNDSNFVPSTDLANVATSGNYNDLSNKPTIPTVNNATLTIQKNGTNVQTFTANQSTNATANITVPTKTSDLTNDSGFITEDNTKIPLAGSNQISGSLIPSTDGTVNLGSPSYQWNNLYAKNYYYNGTAWGLDKANVWNTYQTIKGGNLGNEQSTNGRTCLYLTSNRDTVGKSGIYITKFRQNRGQGGLQPLDLHYLAIDVLENSVRTNGVLQLNVIGWNDEDIPSGAIMFSNLSNAQLGSSLAPWKTINGINPGALSLPSSTYINVDTTNWDLTCQNELMGSFTPTADGWLMLNIFNAGTNEVNFWIIGGVLRINNKSTLNDVNNDNFNMFTIPVEKDVTYNIYGNASEYVAGRSIAYCRFMPCQGNV